MTTDTFKGVLDKWGISIRLNDVILQAEFCPLEADKSAAWSLYVELLTRIASQPLPLNHGDEKTALDSIFSLFATTRTVIKENRGCSEFCKVTVPVLNQTIRPFTAKWHKLSLAGSFNKVVECKKFRKELASLRVELCKFTKALADIAGVEDLTELEGNINETC